MDTTTVVIALAVAYFLLSPGRARTSGGFVYSQSSGLFGTRTSVSTPYGGYSSGPGGTSIVIPQGVLSGIGGGGRSGGGGATPLAQPVPTVDPTATFGPDNLPISDPFVGPVLPLDYTTGPQDPTLDPSFGTDPYSVLAFDPSGGGDLVGALS